MNGSKRTYYIKHIQRAKFDAPVFCEPMLIRLHPRSDAQGTVRSARLDVTPRPTRVERTMDLSGNIVWRTHFSELTIALTVAVTSCVERDLTTLRNDARHVPTVDRAVREDVELSHCYAHAGEVSPELADLTERVFDRCDGSQRDFLRQLTSAFAEQLAPAPRERREYPRRRHPSPHPPNPRWRLAESLAEAGRRMNIPARIVRGYNAQEADEINHEMHVWTEFYLAGYGWCGFDPVCGTEVDHQYIPVAAGRTLAASVSLSANYRGTTRAPESSTQIILREAAHREPMPMLDSPNPVLPSARGSCCA